MTARAAAILKDLAKGRIVEPPMIIVVAHPDDETIGMGAQLCRFRNALLMQITDGAPRDGHDAAAHGFTGIPEYAFARRVELYAALEAGEAGAIQIEIMGLADQEAYRNLPTLTERILQRIEEKSPAAVFVQPYEGGHPDHDAGAFAVHAAVRLSAAAGRSPPTIIEMTAYHATGPHLETGMFLPSDFPVITIDLASRDSLRKRRMIDCFLSQRDLLAGFETEVERFREAPDYDFTQPPHPGELCYERLGWSITGEVWRDRARVALEALGLRPPAWA
jgi:N-acetylglucosamine malate deacetylase 2